MKKLILVIALVLIANFVYASHQPGHVDAGTPAAVSASEGGAKFLGFIEWLFPAMLAAAAILSVLSIAYAGFQWVAAAGNPSVIEDAKDRIFKAIIGLLLALASYLILHTINPALVNPTLPSGPPVDFTNIISSEVKHV